MGLCMGFSLLSLCEFIYFFTLRLFVDWRREKKAFNEAKKSATSGGEKI